MTTAEAGARPIRSLIPARLDRLGWSPFHTRMVCGLGGAWILDGLQITVASWVSGELTKSSTLGMTSTEIGLIEVFIGVQAAGKSLEQVTTPLTSVAGKAAPAASAEPAAA